MRKGDCDMRKIPQIFFSLVLAVIFGLCLAMPGAAAFSGIGSGTEASPYIITTPAQLNEVRNFLGPENAGVHFRLGNDIDLYAYLAPGGAGYAKWGAEGWEPIGNYDNPFPGNFDGNGHKITGLWIDRRTAHNIGLFGVTNAAIKNLGLEIATAGVRGYSSIGGLSGRQLNGSSITNSYTTGNVSGGDVVGGLVGVQFFGSNITNSYATGNVSGGSDVGGLVGTQVVSNITSSYATGNVSGYRQVGGLVGVQLFGSNITNSYATGNVSGYRQVGGLVGMQVDDSSITNSYATGNVSGNRQVGGLVGAQFYDGNITNSYATGNLSGSGQVGGLVGWQRDNSSITNSFRYQFATVNDDILIPADDPASVPHGRHGSIITASELMTQETYIAAGWEFAPSGPWHWDDRGFPKLNIGEEVFPFRFR